MDNGRSVEGSVGFVLECSKFSESERISIECRYANDYEALLSGRISTVPLYQQL